MRRMYRWLGWGVFGLVVLVGSGLLLADRLTPPATGAPGHALALQPAQTEIDRELAPLLAANPGKTGVLLLPDGLDAFAARAIAARVGSSVRNRGNGTNGWSLAMGVRDRAGGRAGSNKRTGWLTQRHSGRHARRTSRSRAAPFRSRNDSGCGARSNGPKGPLPSVSGGALRKQQPGHQSAKGETTVNMRLDYLDTSSSKHIYNIFSRLDAVTAQGRPVKVNWHYETGDEEMAETGKDYESLFQMDFSFIEVEELF